MRCLFKSKLSIKFEEFVDVRIASGRWNRSYDYNLHHFDKYIATNYPSYEELTVEMLNWCKRRETERNNTCISRTTPVRDFLKYANKRGWSALNPLPLPAFEANSYIPHFFTQDELSAFFMECDSYVIRSYQERRHIITLLNRLQLPVYFRLLYSSGMRTCEVRWLKCSDVNFESGIVKIIKSKSIDEHVIVLHDSMLQLLQNYNQAMEKVMPNRIYLFPDKKDEPHKIRWGCTFFKKIWSKVSDEKAVEYDLRSLYAVTNISGWENHGYELSGNSCSYPRSMGHRNIQSTFGYFHLTPMLTDKLKRNCAKKFSELIPQTAKCNEENI